MKNSALTCLLRSTVIVSTSLFLTHCGHSSNNNNPPVNNSQAPSLNGLPANDTLKIKYDKAVLHCQLDIPFKVQLHGVTNQYSGTDSFTWDLINDYSVPRKTQLVAKSGAVTFIVDMKIDSVEIEDVAVLDQTTGTSYQMQYSPVVIGTYSYKTEKPISVGGLVDSPSGKGPLTLYERVEHPILNSAESDQTQGNSASYFMEEHLKCLLDTTSKSQFQNQFSKTSPK